MKHGKAYSQDLRERVIQSREENKWTYEKTAEFFKVGVASISRWVRLKRETGKVNRRPAGPGRQRILDDSKTLVIKELVTEKSDRTINEFIEALEDRIGIRLSSASMSRYLRRLGFTFKKKAYLPLRERKSMSRSGRESFLRKSLR